MPQATNAYTARTEESPVGFAWHATLATLDNQRSLLGVPADSGQLSLMPEQRSVDGWGS